MTLAAPAFLALLALLVPVLITFLVKRRRDVVRVPSTMVWRLAARSVAKSRRLRDLRRVVSLLACLFGLAALALAAARPSGGRAERLVFVVDVSASMDGAPLRDARAFLTREVAGLAPESRVAILAAGGRARVALPFSPPGPIVEDAIAKLEAEKDFAALEDAIGMADGLANGGRQVRVVVLTDHPVDPSFSRGEPKAQQRVFPRPSGADDNVGIIGLSTRAAPDARDDEEREATVAIATSSSRSRRVRLLVTLGGRTLADRRIALAPRGEVSERIGIRGGGRLTARVRPDDGTSDAIALDDEAWLEESAYRPPRVALIRRQGESATAAAFFVERALRAAGVKDPILVAPEETAPKSAEVAVVLADGPARPTDVPAFFIGGAPSELGFSTTVVDRSRARIRSVSSEEPLLRGVAFDELTAVRSSVALGPPASARTLVSLDGGPALLAGGAGPHAWVWMGIDPDASDLVLRVAFPVLMGNVLAQLGGAAQVSIGATAPRSEVQLDAPSAGASLRTAEEPRWRWPVGPAPVLAALGALLLALEAWIAFRRQERVA